jgi:hypothetical protein
VAVALGRATVLVGANASAADVLVTLLTTPESIATTNAVRVAERKSEILGFIVVSISKNFGLYQVDT